MTKKIKDIEDRLRDDRADLAETLADLAGRVAPDYLTEQVSHLIREHAGPTAKRAEEVVRQNPVAFAIAGAGLAWLLLGNRKSEPEPAADPDAWMDKIDALREAASERLNRIEREAFAAKDSARDYVTERAEVLGDFAADLRATLASGLEDLNDEARARIVSAREAAYSARLKMQDKAETATASGTQMIKDHPLIATALGVAIGAALVSAFPKTESGRRELGARARGVMDEAQRLYRTEKDRAGTFASELSQEVRKAARSVSETARTDARQTVRDVSDEATRATQDLAERLARQLADEASRVIKDLGEAVREETAARTKGDSSRLSH